MEETTLAQLANYGALGAIAAVSIWGAARGIGALWGALQRREEQLREALREFADRLEALNRETAEASRAAAEQSRRLGDLLARFSAEANALNGRLERLIDDLDRSLAGGPSGQRQGSGRGERRGEGCGESGGGGVGEGGRDASAA